MNATIEVAGERATLEDGVWKCDDASVARELNLVSDMVQVPGSDPHPLRTRAEEVARTFGGSVIECDAPDTVEAGLLY